MSLRFVHLLGMATVLTLAMLAVLLGGALPSFALIALLFPWLGLLCVWYDWGLPLWLTTTFAVIGVVAALVYGLQAAAENAIVAATLALMAILAGRLLTPGGSKEDLQSLVLSLLLMFTGTVLHQQFTYGLIFVAYAITICWTLITRQLIAGLEQQWPTPEEQPKLQAAMARSDLIGPRFFLLSALIASMILCASSVVFLTFPRMGFGQFGIKTHGLDRLPEDVSLAGPPRLSMASSAVIARIRGLDYPAYLRGLYLRAAMYDQLAGSRFVRSIEDDLLRPSRLQLAAVKTASKYEVFLQPVTEQALMTLGTVYRAKLLTSTLAEAASGANQVSLLASGELESFTPLTGPVRYTIEGTIAHPRAGIDLPSKADAIEQDKRFYEHFVALPANLDGRIAPLALEKTAAAVNTVEQVAMIRRFLLQDFSYSLQQPNGTKQDPLAAFLFDDRRGHCEYFATAFAVLLRTLGIGSRLIGGYQGGTWDENGNVVVMTGENAHAWIEWYLPGVGWIVDDATPVAEAVHLQGFAAILEQWKRSWDDNIVEFGLDQQLGLVTGLLDMVKSPALPRIDWSTSSITRTGGSWLLPVLLLVLLLLLGGYAFVWRQRQRSKLQHHVLGQWLWRWVRALLAQPIPSKWTLRHAVDRAVARTENVILQQALHQGVWLWELAVFTQQSVPPQQLWQTLQQLQTMWYQQPAQDRRFFRQYRSSVRS